MTSLSDYGVQISMSPMPEPIPDEQKYELLRVNLTYDQAVEYCQQNLKTHPSEKVWFFLIPGAGLFRVCREVEN